MKNSLKPRKRMIFYLFFEKGYFFIMLSLFFWFVYLYRFTDLYFTARIMIYMIPFLSLFSMLMIIYEWSQTDYYLMKNYVFLKDLNGLKKLKYMDIRKVYTMAPVLQLLMGTANVCLETSCNDRYYIKGIRNFRELESRIIHNMHREL